jgi:hypothetical protein
MGWTLDFIFTATHDDELPAFYGFVGKGLSLFWANWADHRWVFDLIPVLACWAYWTLSGWLIARLHEPVGRSVVAAFIFSYAVYHTFQFANFAMAPPDFYAIRDTGVIICTLSGGRVFSRGWEPRRRDDKERISLCRPGNPC